MLRLVTVLLCLYGASGRQQKSVITSLDTKWRQTSVIAETSEFLGKESPAHFWAFVRKLAKEADGQDLMSDSGRYALALKLGGSLVSAARLDLLKFALSLRVHSPAVHMFRTMAEDAQPDAAARCGVFADVHGAATCDVSELKGLLAAAKPESASDAHPSVDHSFPSAAAPTTRVILYASLEDPAFAPWHAALAKLAREGKLQYVLRHFDKATEGGRKVRLSGYGVELAIKSTEYKAQDDTQIKANVTEGGAVVEEEVDLNGFNFQKLREIYPDHQEQLTELKLHMLEAEEVAPLKVWQLQDLSYQAAQRVVNGGPKEALQQLTDLSQNFPVIARALTRTTVKSELRKEVERNQAESLEELGVSPGESALFVNGQLLDLDTTDVFQLLDMLKREEKLSAGFFKMGFRREYLTLLMSLDTSGGGEGGSYGVDVRSAFPDYVNDLDRDPDYREWGNSVKLLLQPYFPGMIRPIARNFFTLVFVVDPAAMESRSLLKIAFSFFAHDIPIRVGLVWATNADKSVSGKDDLGIAIVNLYQMRVVRHFVKRHFVKRHFVNSYKKGHFVK